MAARVGTLVRFDEARGYGFIAPPDGGGDVFVHVNDFGDARHLIYSGMRVEYEATEGERGLKVISVRPLDGGERPVAAAPAVTAPPAPARVRNDPAEDEECDILTAEEFTAEVTERLLLRVGSMSGDQIRLARECLVDLARSHGWIEVQPGTDRAEAHRRGGGYPLLGCGEERRLARLRRKLEPEPAHPRYLLTEPGKGYRFQP